MDDTTTPVPPKAGSEPAAEPVGPARDGRKRANQGAGWCTTLDQPATMGVFGFVVAYFLRRRRR